MAYLLPVINNAVSVFYMAKRFVPVKIHESGEQFGISRSISSLSSAISTRSFARSLSFDILNISSIQVPPCSVIPLAIFFLISMSTFSSEFAVVMCISLFNFASNFLRSNSLLVFDIIAMSMSLLSTSRPKNTTRIG